MRLFFAAPLPTAFFALAQRAQGTLAQGMRKGRMTAPGNLHLTLAFLGELPEPEPAIAAADDLGSAAFVLRSAGLGRFVKRGGDVVYLDIEPDSALLELVDRLRGRLKAAGLLFEDGAYHPHITLARGVRMADDFACLQGADLPPAAAEVDRFCLMRSWRPEGELIYTPLQTWHLQCS